jgi:hypothetical protein
MKASPFTRLFAITGLLVAGVAGAQEAPPAFAQVRIDAAFVEYRLADVDPLVRDQRVTAEALREIWAAGKGRLLSAPSVITKSGQEAVAKSVTEVIYPTEYWVEPAGGRGAPAQTNAVVAGRAAALIPGSFEMREIGAILQAIPEVSAEGGEINLILNPQLIRSPEWKNYEIALAGFDGQAARSAAEQPQFPVVSVSTSLRLRNGTMVLAGGGAGDGRSDTTVYLFVTATLVDAEGRALQGVRGNDEHR